jgi:hypothetical protein
MSLALLILGLVVAASGVATIGFGIPINEFTLGTTLIVAGTTALTGGLLLVGISAVLSELARLREGKPLSPGASELRPEISAAPSVPGPLTVAVPQAMRPAGPAQPAPRPKPEPQVQNREPRVPAAPTPSSVEISAAAIERLRTTVPRPDPQRAPASGEVEEVPLSPTEAAQQTPPARPVEETPVPEPKVTAEDRTAESAAEALKASRLDFLFRAKPARPARQPENFDAIWPAETKGNNRARSAEAQTKHEQVERQPARSQVATEPAPERPQVVKSGVVDGMAYTLYADGSIEAKLPEGTVRFGSIAELRAHIEKNS